MQIISLRESLYFLNGDPTLKTYMILNVIEYDCDGPYITGNVSRQRNWIGFRDNRCMNNLLRNCLCFQLWSPECFYIYCIPEPRRAVLSDPMSDINTRLCAIVKIKIITYICIHKKVLYLSVFIFEIFVIALSF